MATVDFERTQTEQIEDGRGIARSQKGAERYISKRQTLQDRKDECTKLIRDLGVLPEEAFEKYKEAEPTKVRAAIPVSRDDVIILIHLALL